MTTPENKTGRLEKQRTFLTKFCYWAAIAAILYVVIKFGLPVLYPFLIAAIIAWILNRPIRFLVRKTKFKRQVVCIFVVALFFVIVGLLLALAGTKIFHALKDLAVALPSFLTNTVMPLLEDVIQSLQDALAKLPNSDSSSTSDLSFLTQAFSKGTQSASSFLLNAVTNVASVVPSVFLKTIITIIATVFISLDYEKIRAFVSRQIPDDKRIYFREAREFFGGTLPKCLGAYILIMCITFSELSVGFLILRIPNPFLIALIVAIVDILPVLGTGTVLIPWAVICMVMGNFGLGVGLFVLYLIITVIRNTIEPKLVGSQIGLHPILTFAGMLLGLKYMGFLGMFGVPLTLAFINSLNQKKIIHVFK